MGLSAGMMGMGYTWLEASAEPAARPGVLAVVKVQNFRYVSAGARIGLSDNHASRCFGTLARGTSAPQKHVYPRPFGHAGPRIHPR